MNKTNPVNRYDHYNAAYLVPHVRLELKLGRWAEGCGVHLHEPLPVAPRVQAVHCILNDVQPFMARRLQVVFGR